MTISATRMERNNQRSKARVARRGHKLLKDKSDEMFRNLTDLSASREKISQGITSEIERAIRQFLYARVNMSAIEIDNAIATAHIAFVPQPEIQNIMGLRVPHLHIKHPEHVEHHTARGFRTTHPAFDHACNTLENVIDRLVELASLDKTCAMLEAEIKRLRRRVNALEHAVIPQINQNIETITAKLAENERGNLVRLIKVKEIINEQTNANK